MAVHKAGCLNKHTAGTTSRVQDFLFAILRLENFYHVADNGCRCIEGSAVFSFLKGKLTKEEFVDFAKEVYADVFRNIHKDAHDVGKKFRFFFGHKLTVHFFWKNAIHLFIFAFYGFHCLFYEGCFVCIIGRIVNCCVVSFWRKVKAAVFD